MTYPVPLFDLSRRWSYLAAWGVWMHPRFDLICFDGYDLIWFDIYLVTDGVCDTRLSQHLGASYSTPLRTPLLMHLVFRGLPSEYMTKDIMIWFDLIWFGLVVDNWPNPCTWYLYAYKTLIQVPYTFGILPLFITLFLNVSYIVLYCVVTFISVHWALVAQPHFFSCGRF